MVSGPTQTIAETEARLTAPGCSEPLMRTAKQAASPDRTIAKLTRHSEAGVRAQRLSLAYSGHQANDTLAGNRRHHQLPLYHLPRTGTT